MVLIILCEYKPPGSTGWNFLAFTRQSVPTYWSTAVDIATLTLRITGDVAKRRDGEARGYLGEFKIAPPYIHPQKYDARAAKSPPSGMDDLF